MDTNTILTLGGFCVFACVAGCAVSPIVISDRGIALGLYQAQRIEEGETLRYDRLAGFGIAAWDGALTLGYTDRAKLVIDPEGPPVAFRAPELSMGSTPSMEVYTGALAERYAKPWRLMTPLAGADPDDPTPKHPGTFEAGFFLVGDES